MPSKKNRHSKLAVTAIYFLIASQTTPFAICPIFARNFRVSQFSQSEIEKLLSKTHIGYLDRYKMGLFYESKGLLEQAREQYELAVKEKAPQPEGYKHLAQVCFSLEDPALAELTLTEAIRRFPRDYGIYLLFGYILHNEHKLSEALGMYRKAMSISPEKLDVYLATADVLLDMKKPKEALPLIQHVLKQSHPSSLAYFEQAKALIAVGQPAQAIKPLSHVFAIDPFNFRTGELYSSTLRQCGNYELALEVELCLMASSSGKLMDEMKSFSASDISRLSSNKVRRMIKEAEGRMRSAKEKAILHFALGDVFDRLGRRDEALSQYLSGLSFNSKFARGYLRIGEDLEDGSGDYREALENYEKAFLLDPKDVEIKIRRDKMRAFLHLN